MNLPPCIKYLKFSAFVLLLIAYTSCTVQKRVYKKGYYISWQKDKKINNPNISAEKKDYLTAVNKNKDLPAEHHLSLHHEEKLSLAEEHKQPNLPAVAYQLEGDTCDVLLYKDGSKILVKLIEISEKEIKYKRCDNPSGPIYVSSKSELYMIKHRNGQEELIRVEEPPRRQPTPNPNYNDHKYKQDRYGRGRVVHPAAPFALAFGILSLVLGYAWIILLSAGVIYGYTFLFTVLAAAAIAVIAGNRANRDIRNDPEHYKGKGLSMPGFIFGIVILGIAATIGLIFLVAI
jgi:hypothetical protein